MYSPKSDLHKMIYTPEFIAFRVKIEGIEFIGRPNTITYNASAEGTKQQGLFYAYDGIESFIAGNHFKEIPVTSHAIIGIEAIDTVTPGPLNDILSACYEIENIPVKANIGFIRRNIPEILQRLCKALEEYEHVHSFIKFEIVFFEIQNIIKDCETCGLPDNDREAFIRILKDKISYRVSNFINLQRKSSN